jgi:septum formation protein
MGLPVEVCPGSIGNESDYFSQHGICRGLMKLARAKAESLPSAYNSRVILAADTIVKTEHDIFEKPADADQAHTMLRHLSGKTHEVITAVSLIQPSTGFCTTKKSVTQVTFRTITDEEILYYLHGDSFLDKAGGYGIQNLGAIFVKSLRGCYFNVVGLPVATTIELLQDYNKYRVENEQGQKQ